MKLVLAGFFFLAAGLGAGPVDEHVKTANKLMRKGRLRDAKLELEVAHALAPQRQDVIELLASLKEGAPKLEALPEARSASTSQVEAALAQARAAYRDSDIKGATEAWRRALLLQPGEDESLEGLARVEAEAYRFDKDQPFDQSVAQLYEAGMREARKGRFVEAKRKLDEALALNPTHAQLKASLMGLAKGAQQEQQSLDAEALVLMGRQAMAEKDLGAAGSAFQQALKQSPGLDSAEAGMAEVRALGGQAAQAALKKGQGALDQGRWGEAQDQFKLALAMNPELAEASEGLKAALARSQSAQNVAEQRREADRAYNAGVEAWSAGDLGTAASRFREALKADPQDAEAQKALQAVHRKLDERAEKDRLDAQNLLEEARTLEGRGAPEEALKRYERAKAKDPALAEASKAIDRLKGEIQLP